MNTMLMLRATKIKIKIHNSTTEGTRSCKNNKAPTNSNSNTKITKSLSIKILIT